ncbi:MAG: GDSL-type esterase/lipase family protein [Ferruginibacter sp.]
MKKLRLLFFLLLGFITGSAQPERFSGEIKAFKKQDSIHPPPQNAILLIGSSSFTKWTDVQDYFPGHTIINRGFGGSTLPDLIYFVKDVIIPYHPKQIIIYCGDNDFVAPGGATAAIVVERVKQLFQLIRAQYPKVPVAYVSIKPSPSREKFLPLVKEANAMIKQLTEKEKHISFINIFDAMLNTDGSINKDIFLSDNLHMNAKGYKIWADIMKPYLK